MGKKSTPAPPPAPDYRAAAEQTAQGNLDMAKYTTQANRVNQYTPWGDSTWEKTVGPDGVEQWAQRTTVDPVLQDALNSQFNIQSERSQYASDLLGRVKDSYAQDFNAPDFSNYLTGVKDLNQNAPTVDRSGPQLDYNAPGADSYFAGTPGVNLDFSKIQSYLQGVNGVNQNAPTYDENSRLEAQNAAFNAANSFLAPQYQQQEQKMRDALALQGLNVGGEATNDAMKSFYDSKNQAYNQLANQAVLTGSQVGSQDLQNRLAAFAAGNQAQNQAFGQGLTKAGFDNNVINQFNQAQGQMFGQNQAKFDNAMQSWTAGNTAKQMGIQNNLAYNQADLNAFNASNSARNQAYANALNRYQTDYGAAMSERNLPLNELNALLTGQQVNSPQFQDYYNQANVLGPDYLGATQAQAGYDQNAWNAQAAGAQNKQAAAGQTAATAVSVIAMAL